MRIPLLLLLVMLALPGAVRARVVHDLSAIVLRAQDVPTQTSVTGPEYPSVPSNNFVLYRHFNAEMSDIPKSKQATTYNYGYRCYPPAQFARLGWRQGLSQELYNRETSVWRLCAFLFSDTSHAHRAYSILAGGIKRGLHESDVNRFPSLPRIGQERTGYLLGQYQGRFDITFRQDNAVVQLSSQASVLYSAKQFADLARLISLRLH